MILNTATLNTNRGEVVADLSYTDKSGMFVTALDGAYRKGTRIAQSHHGEQGLIAALIKRGVDADQATRFVTE